MPPADLRAAVPALVRLLQSHVAEVQRQALLALCNAAQLGAEARAVLQAADAIPALLGIAEQCGRRRWWQSLSPTPNAEAAMRALGYLAQGERQRAAILGAEGGPEVFHQLLRSGDEVMRRIAEQALEDAACLEDAAAAEEEAAAAAKEAAKAAAAAAAPASEAAPASVAEAEPEEALHASKADEQLQRQRKACAACGATTSLRRCAACLAMRYCSTECQAGHWHDHRRTCRRLQAERAAAAGAQAV